MKWFFVLFQIIFNIFLVQSFNTDSVINKSRNSIRNTGNYPEVSGYSKSFRRSRTSKEFNFTPNQSTQNHDDQQQKTEDDANNYLRNFKPFLDEDTDKLTEQQKLLLRNIADHLAQYEPEIIQEHQRKSLNLNNDNVNEGRARTKKNSRRKAKRPLTSIVVVQDQSSSTNAASPPSSSTTTIKTPTTQNSSLKTTVKQPSSSTTLKATTKSASSTKSASTKSASRQNAKIASKVTSTIATTNKPTTTKLPTSVTAKDAGRGDTSSKPKPDQQPAESKVCSLYFNRR